MKLFYAVKGVVIDQASHLLLAFLSHPYAPIVYTSKEQKCD